MWRSYKLSSGRIIPAHEGFSADCLTTIHLTVGCRLISSLSRTLNNAFIKNYVRDWQSTTTTMHPVRAEEFGEHCLPRVVTPDLRRKGPMITCGPEREWPHLEVIRLGVFLRCQHWWTPLIPFSISGRAVMVCMYGSPSIIMPCQSYDFAVVGISSAVVR